MIASNPTLNDLFGQLGLPSDAASIDSFIDRYKGLSQSVHIEDAPFWTESQAAFIQGSLIEDAEWAELIDQLNNRLR